MAYQVEGTEEAEAHEGVAKIICIITCVRLVVLLVLQWTKWVSCGICAYRTQWVVPLLNYKEAIINEKIRFRFSFSFFSFVFTSTLHFFLPTLFYFNVFCVISTKTLIKYTYFYEIPEIVSPQIPVGAQFFF